MKQETWVRSERHHKNDSSWDVVILFTYHNSKNPIHICCYDLLSLFLHLNAFNITYGNIQLYHFITLSPFSSSTNKKKMAQAMLLMPGISTNTLDFNRNALLKLQIHKIKPKSSSSYLFFSPLPSSSSSSSSALRTLAIFKPKTKAPAKKVPNFMPSFFLLLMLMHLYF